MPHSLKAKNLEQGCFLIFTGCAAKKADQQHIKYPYTLLYIKTGLIILEQSKENMLRCSWKAI